MRKQPSPAMVERGRRAEAARRQNDEIAAIRDQCFGSQLDYGQAMIEIDKILRGIS